MGLGRQFAVLAMAAACAAAGAKGASAAKLRNILDNPNLGELVGSFEESGIDFDQARELINGFGGIKELQGTFGSFNLGEDGTFRVTPPDQDPIVLDVGPDHIRFVHDINRFVLRSFDSDVIDLREAKSFFKRGKDLLPDLFPYESPETLRQRAIGFARWFQDRIPEEQMEQFKDFAGEFVSRFDESGPAVASPGGGFAFSLRDR